MATASKNPSWTKEHEDALSGLVGLGISKKEARQFLETLAGEYSGELMRKALASRSRGQRPPPNTPPGAPINAVPIHPQSPNPVQEGSSAQMAGAPPRPHPTPPSAPLISGPWSGASMIPAGGKQPAKAPIGPAAAQLQAPTQKTPAAPSEGPPPYTQVVGAPPGWKPSDAGIAKPRIRVRAAGTKIPAAPLGGEGPTTEATSPTKEPETPTAAAETPTKNRVLPLIHSVEEYNQLAPGTEFIWRSDGHIYEKPAAKGGE